jgi:hypothetical protein
VTTLAGFLEDHERRIVALESRMAELERKLGLHVPPPNLEALEAFLVDLDSGACPPSLIPAPDSTRSELSDPVPSTPDTAVQSDATPDGAKGGPARAPRFKVGDILEVLAKDERGMRGETITVQHVMFDLDLEAFVYDGGRHIFTEDELR